MAQEIKNTFLKSKMNKDLDDRILPNGEYRDALNISVGRSEDNDVGALENIIGNNLVSATDIDGDDLTIIGVHGDNSGDTIYVFLTDYTELNTLNPTNAPAGSKHYIYSYNPNLNIYTKLVQGEFLNFSKTNRIVGVNLLENLLFWTDNRNQPRKININLARAFDPGGLSTVAGDYYTEEHQISVAKYSPYSAMDLYSRIDLKVTSGTTSVLLKVAGDRVAELSKFIGASVVCLESSPPTQGINFVKVVSVSLSPAQPPETIITVSPAMQIAPSPGSYISLISSTMSNKNDDDLWPGDPDYLEDKFVRFSYRFKFDDNEYSLMAPFTQIAYIPKQKGYLINGDESAAYRSTVLGFMENSVQNVGLIITLPSQANKLIDKYKINEIEILFRESDGIAVKVLESIKASKVSAESDSSNTYTYEYQSRKPYRTLPEAQTVRVYDKVPVRAFAQETSGNRIIYGNFADKHTPPSAVNYNCRIAKKSSTGAYNNFIEYPNHSVKRNRNYQIGFVLSDKFGRQSPVILSSVDLGGQSNGQFFSGSTIYSPYDIVDTDTDVETWFGDAIQVLVNEPIASNRDLQAGTPGLYAEPTQRDSSGEGFAIAPNLQSPAFITNTTYTFLLNDGPAEFPNNTNVPAVGDYMRGAYQDFVEVTGSINPASSTWIITTDGRVSDVYLRTDGLPSTTPDLKFAYTINDVGWYSYRVVVKQTEQDYYNAYLPGILNGYPGQSTAGITSGPFPDDEINLTAHTVLFNDNINKIPRDLNEVGDQDRQYRSSVELYGRVSNIMVDGTPNDGARPGNVQYYPRLNYSGKNAITHTAIAIAAAKDFDMSFTELSDSSSAAPQAADGNLTFYQIDSNPLIARISTTEKSIGWGAEGVPNPKNTIWNMQPYLAIYETEPVESLLDIYWETTSSGLIVDLNAEVATQNDGIFAFEGLTWEFRESITNGDSVTPSYFTPINNQGEPYTTPVSGELFSVTNANGDTITFFELEQGTGSNLGKFLIKYTGNGIVFEEGSGENDIYSFVLRMESNGIITDIPLIGEAGGFGALENVRPDFNTLSNVVKTIDDITLIPAATFAGTTNGTELAGAKSLQLVYSFYATNPQTPFPENWEMNPVNGSLSQLTPDLSGNTFTGNPLGNYPITIRVTDANAETPENTVVPAYTSLFKEQDMIISLAEAGVNPGALSTTCAVAPSSLPLDPVAWASSGFYGGQIYYISNSSNLTIDDFLDNGVVDVINAGGTPIKIGTESHRRGQICFTLNMSGFDYWAGTPPFALLYYRISGNTQWIPITRSVELNRVGQGANSYSGQFLGGPYDSGPQPVNPTGTFNPPFNLALESNGSGAWYCNWIRAFDYLDLREEGSSAGVEYAIVTQGMQTFSGTAATTICWVTVDDLNYPKCIPWQGANLVDSNGGVGNYFKYIKSSGGPSAVNFVDISSSTDYVYSKTGLGDYVNLFYSDSNGNSAYTPNSGSNYINVKLDKSALSPVPPTWKTLQGAQVFSDVDLQWVVGYNDESGVKIQNLNTNEGVSAVQVSGGNFFYTITGTGRIGIL